MPIEEAVALRQTRLLELRPQLEAALAGHAQVTLEIGCGHGHFLTAYARDHPAEFCLAIDIIRDRLLRADRKARRAGLTNVAWIHANAADLLAALPATVRFGPRLFILFPDPWPKRRHWKNRLLQADFLTALAARTAPGAQLCFRTDHAPYFAATSDLMATHPDWAVDPEPCWPFEQPTVFQQRADAYQSLTARRR